MQPTQLALVIHKGATFRARFRVSQPTPEYRDITAIIPSSPVRLAVDHGLPTDWQVWIDRVRQLPDLNRALNRQQPHIARVLDAQTLEITTINASGTNASGGQIVYYPPLPLAGATAILTLYEKGAAAGTLAVTVDPAGWVDLLLTDEQTALLDWSEQQYTLDIELSSGDVLRAYQGSAMVQVAGMSVPATCQGFAVIGGDRGPPGPTVSSAQFDTQGRLVITLEDGAVITTGILARVWGSITGTLTDQIDLADKLGTKTDLNDFLAFVQQTNDALAARYTKTEMDQLLLGKVDVVAGKQLSTNDYTTTEKDKLGLIAPEATKNATDAQLRDRATHTGTQSAATISDFNTAAAAAAPVQSVDGLTGPVQLGDRYEQKRKNNLAATTNPTVANDSTQEYEPLSKWLNTVTGEVWLCVSAAVGAADWQQATLTLDELGSAALADVGEAPAQLPDNQSVDAKLELKVDKVTGKQLSTEDYTTAEKSKLSGIAAGATVNTKATTVEALAGTADKYPDAAGVRAAFEQYGLGKSPQLVATVSVDSLIESGFYYHPNSQVGIPHADNGSLLVNMVTASFGTQTAINIQTGVTFFRTRSAGTWSSWKKIWADNNQLALGITPASARTALGLGTLSTQNASAVAITGGTALLSAGSEPALRVVRDTGGPIVRFSKSTDPFSFFALESGTFGDQLVPLMRSYNEDANVGLYLVGSSGTDTGSNPLIRLSARIGDASVANRSLLDVANVNDPVFTILKTGAVRATGPIQPGNFTVATLPAAADNGAIAYATNGRKAGEAAAAGTGVPVHYQSGWKTFYDNTAVQA